MDTQTAQPGLPARLYARVTAQPVILLFVITFAVVAFLNPVKIALLVYGLNKLALFSWVGLRIDIWLFPDDRPETLAGPAQGAAWKRRTLIVIACIAFAALLP